MLQTTRQLEAPHNTRPTPCPRPASLMSGLDWIDRGAEAVSRPALTASPRASMLQASLRLNTVIRCHRWA